MIKTITDYEDQICQMFPHIPKTDIRKILNYGWKQIYLCNSYGGDVCVTNNKFYFYCGKALIDPLKHFVYYTKKLLIKAITMYKRKKVKWDGYYYFSLTDPQQNNLNEQLKTHKKNLCYGNQILFKNYDECKVRHWNRKYIYRVKFNIDYGNSIYLPNFTTNLAQLYEEKKSITYNEVFTSFKGNYKYI